MFVPPSAEDFNEWEALGNQGWGWKSLGTYFRKFHTLVPPDAKLREHVGINWIDDKVTATDGPIQASFTDSPENPLGKAFVGTCEKLGAGITADPFSGHSTGAFSCPASVDPATKTRSYSASAYYAPAAQRPNLDVLTGANAKVIALEGCSGGSPLTARAVVFTDKDGQHQVKAKHEVILAAGAFQTPKLLELSGIGNKSLLQKLGITCKVDSPGIGENLQDHLMTGVSFEVADGVMTGDPLVRKEPRVVEMFMQMYQEHHAGPLASAALMSYAFTPILEATIEKLDAGAQKSLEQAVKDLQQTNEPSVSTNQRSAAEYLTRLLQAKTESTGALFALPVQVNLHNGPQQIGMTTNPVEGNYLSIGAALVHPLSRGSSHITSVDPDTPPVIDPRYLSHPFDVEVYARHLMAIEALAATEPLSSLLKPGGRRAQPGPNGARVDTVERAKEYIRATALSNNHPVGTCCMAPRDKGGVVDAELKVYGVEGLRVVDSSIMPLIPQANTQTTVYAVAEKAADLIKQSYGL